MPAIKLHVRYIIDTVYVVILANTKFGDLAPNWAIINIGEILIWQSAQPNLHKSPGVKSIGGT